MSAITTETASWTDEELCSRLGMLALTNPLVQLAVSGEAARRITERPLPLQADAAIEAGARALHEDYLRGLHSAAAAGMRLVATALTPWDHLHPENRACYLRQSEAVLRAAGLVAASFKRNVA